MNYINIFTLLSHIAFIYGFYFGTFCTEFNTNLIYFFTLFTLLTIKKRNYFIILIVSLSFLIGIFIYKRFQPRDHPNDKFIKENFLTFKGIIETYPRYNSRNTQTLVKVSSMSFNHLEISFNVKVLLFIKGTFIIGKGDSISFVARLNSVADDRIDGISSYSDYLLKSEILYTSFIGSKNRIQKIGSGMALFSYISNLRREIHFILKEFDRYGVIEALLLSEKDSLDSDFRQNIIRTQLMHIFVVSGLHIGIMFLFVVKLLNFILRQFACLIHTLNYKKISSLISIVCLLPYMLILDFQPCATRAYIQCIIYVFSIMITRKISLFNSLLISSIIQTTLDPKLILNPSFILSYISVLSIALIGVPISRRFIKCKNKKLRSKMKKYILTSLIITLSVSFGLTPILISYFGFISPWSPLFNLLIVPFASIILTPLSILFGILFIISKNLALHLIYPIEFLTFAMDRVISLNNYLPLGEGLYLHLNHVLILYSFILSIYLTITSRKYFILFILSIVTIISLLRDTEDFRVKIFALKTKNEQILFIKNNLSRRILYVKKCQKKINPLLISYLISNERSKIDFLITQNIDEKIIELTKKLQIKKIITHKGNIPELRKFREKINNEKIDIEFKDNYFFIDQLKVNILAPALIFIENGSNFNLLDNLNQQNGSKPSNIVIK